MPGVARDSHMVVMETLALGSAGALPPSPLGHTVIAFMVGVLRKTITNARGVSSKNGLSRLVSS